MSESGIHDKVRAWAQGMYTLEAGAELLIQAGFVHEGAPYLKPGAYLDGSRVWIDTETLLESATPWSGGEKRLVFIACSLLASHPVALDEVIPGLDGRSLNMVLAAIAHANGTPDAWQRMGFRTAA